MKSKIFRVVTALVTASMLISAAGTPAAVAQGTVPPRSINTSKLEQLQPTEIKSLTGRYTILFEEDSLVMNLAKTEGSSSIKVDANDAYLTQLRTAQNEKVSQISSELKHEVTIEQRFDVILNGVTVSLSAQEAAYVASLPGVKNVIPETINHIDTDAGPEWINADEIWNDTAVPGDNMETQGEGILVGILDTGINFDHPSFAETAVGDSYVYPVTDPVGVCDSADPAYDADYAGRCNNKLIGAYSFVTESMSPEDSDGHGSHTASTVAGNHLSIVENGASLNISGVAPHAQIIAYDVCQPGGCSSISSTAAVQQAILNGVDVINYSISGGTDPYNDTVELAFLEAAEAGIFVATSGGNRESEPTTDGYVNHLSPWVTTVAASSHDRDFFNTITNFSANAISDINGKGLSESVSGTIVFADDYSSNALCAPSVWSAATFTSGQIVLCDRGNYALVDKIAAVKDAGAGGVIIRNVPSGATSLPTLSFDLPGTMINSADGITLKTWMDANVGATVTITAAVGIHDDAYGDIKADFSFRGPGTNDFEILKPEVTAPGLRIIAAVADGVIADDSVAEYDMYQGTSMSSPHVAGSAALMKALHPTWTPFEIKSALMMSSKTTNLLKEDETTPADAFDFGAGRVDLSAAAKAGLVLNETGTNFESANPADNGDVTTLNIASMQNNACVGSCSWTRTFTNVADVSAQYARTDLTAWLDVSPTSFTLAPGETEIVTFTANTDTMVVDEWTFGSVVFESTETFTTGESISAAHLPIAVMASNGNLPKSVTKDIYRDSGAVILSDLLATEITDLSTTVYGLVKAVPQTISLVPDATNSEVYDDLDQVFYTTFEVTPGTKRIVAEILDTTASDLDMFWGVDDNSDGMPEEAEEIGRSATGVALEYLSLMDPDPDTYWLLIQNWDGTATGDDIIYALTQISGLAEGNLTIEGPTSNPAVTPFSLTLNYSEDTEVGDRLYGVFEVGSTASAPADISTTAIDLARVGDEVVKTADVTSAKPGDTITYTVSTIDNTTGHDVDYTFRDVLPEGVTLIQSSLPAGATYDIGTRTITYTAMSEYFAPHYTVSTNASNPYCTNIFGGPGYFDIETELGWSSSTSLSGDEIFWSYSSGAVGGKMNYFGSPIAGNPYFTDDGYALMIPSVTAANFSATPQNIPDPASPNGMYALWNDMVIVADAATNKGVTAGGVSGSSGFFFIEFDDVQPKSDPTSSIDYEYMAYNYVDPDLPEIMFAFDNITGSFDWDANALVGLENLDGTIADKYTGTLSNDLVVCFDLTYPRLAFSYQVTVDQGFPMGTPLVNTVYNDTTEPNTVEEASANSVSTPTTTAPEAVSRNIYRDSGQVAITNLYGPEITELTTGVYGMVKAVPEVITLPSDTTSNAYDNLSQVFTTTFDVVAGTKRIVSEILSTDATNTNLYWGLDSNDNGLPDLSEELGRGATTSALEYLSELDPTAGSYWLMIQNRSGSATSQIEYALTQIGDSDAGNLTVSGPATQAIGTSFDLLLDFDEDTEIGDHLYGVYTVGSSSSNPTDIAVSEIDLVRVADEVTKEADVTTATRGDTITYTVSTIQNTTGHDVEYTFRDVLPEDVTLDVESLPLGATYDVDTRTISYVTTVATSHNLMFTYQVVVDSNYTQPTMPMVNTIYNTTTEPNTGEESASVSVAFVDYYFYLHMPLISKD